jgi:hypothetical protein
MLSAFLGWDCAWFVMLQLLPQNVQLVGFLQWHWGQPAAIRRDKNRVLGRHKSCLNGDAIAIAFGGMLMRQLFRLVREIGSRLVKGAIGIQFQGGPACCCLTFLQNSFLQCHGVKRISKPSNLKRGVDDSKEIRTGPQRKETAR